MPLKTRATASPSEHRLPVVVPYRLDLTANVLRRFSTNVVDVFTEDGRYVRALAGPASPLLVEVVQTAPDELRVRVEGAVEDTAHALASVRRMLGTERDVSPFSKRAARIPWLRGIARRMQGVKPPRYPTLFEACVNAIVFQQVSLHAASAILRRGIEALGQPVVAHGVSLYAFPDARMIATCSETPLREAGFSASKIATVRRVAEALLDGTLRESELEARDSPGASAMLTAIKGIGPWTAAVILLRGLGRLDVFPEKDSGVARSFQSLAAGVPVDAEGALSSLGDQRGMLYYHLLLARLEARGALPEGAAKPAATRPGSKRAEET